MLDVSDSSSDIKTYSSEILKSLSQYANKNCLIWSLNINSVNGKFSKVQERIEAFDTLTIQVTKIDRSFTDSQFAINDYDMYCRDRKKGGEGIAVYIRKSLPSHRLRVVSSKIKSIL